VVSEPTDIADAVVTAIHDGDVAGLRQLLADHPDVVSAPLGGRYKSRTPLHVVTDWPGYFPNGPEIVRVLVEAGADPNFVAEPGDETPLHWAASSGDAHVAVALIDAGADLNVLDGSIGTPLANAVGYACWDVARLLIGRGARVDEPWQAAALGLLDRLEQLLGDHPPADEVSRRSGTPAPEGNAAPPNTCSAAVPTRTGYPTTPETTSAQVCHWLRLAGVGPADPSITRRPTTTSASIRQRHPGTSVSGFEAYGGGFHCWARCSGPGSQPDSGAPAG
jgi:hypothetical protein